LQDRNSKTAQAMSRHYAATLASIPLPPPTPPRRDDYSARGLANGYGDEDEDEDGFGVYEPVDHLDRSFGPDADGGASKLGQSSSFHYGPETIHSFQASIGLRSGTRGTMKPGALSDGSSDRDGSMQKGRTVAAKKRRITSDLVDELDASLNADHLSASSPRVLPSSAKTKGKSRLVTQRELSHDSVSLTPANRRRRSAPRRKLDHLAPDRVDLLGLSHPDASASGEASPAFSRPASPAIAMSIVYELHEPIPPLKRAKKIDGGAMLKRVKALEETQRKVWVNIARRDIPKVRGDKQARFAPKLIHDSCLNRFTSTMLWGIKPDKHSWSGSQG
jgi:DNA helicase INO80